MHDKDSFNEFVKRGELYCVTGVGLPPLAIHASTPQGAISWAQYENFGYNSATQFTSKDWRKYIEIRTAEISM